ncbi:murein transglycosylase [bacterium]|nr:murein transglycosylase [bacterium]
MKRWRIAGGLLTLALLAGCESMPPEWRDFFQSLKRPPQESAVSSPTQLETSPGPKVIKLGSQVLRMEPVAFGAMEGWADDVQQDALRAFRDSCISILRMDDKAPVKPEVIGGKAADWKPACQQAFIDAEADHATAREFFEGYFTPYRVIGDKEKPAFYTGYYEYSMKAELKRTPKAQIPIYAVPNDLVMADPSELGAPAGPVVYGRRQGNELVPYYTREEIDHGDIASRARVLAYAYDRVDLFFLQVQGSGRLVLSNGESRRIGFAAKNGQPYHAIGKTLMEKGYLEKDKVSAEAIQTWLRDNPGKAQDIMHTNPSYVFFKWQDGDAPVGASGAPLTPERSLAVDRSLLPMALPVWVDTVTPELPSSPSKAYRHLTIAQDTGSAITGPGRADIFWGSGDEAAAMAGAMKSPGEMILLLPKTREQGLTDAAAAQP